MSTTTDVREERLSKEELEALAHPKRPLKQRVGVVLSYVGMAAIVLYCIIPFYWMIVSSLRLPSEGRSTEFIPSPVSIENYQAVFSPAEQLRPFSDQLGDRGRHHDDPDLAVRDHRSVRARSTEVPGQGCGALADHGLLNVSAGCVAAAAAEAVFLD